MESVVILNGLRSPIGCFMGSLSSLSAPELAGQTIKEVLKSSPESAPFIDEVIIGQVLQGGVGQAPARQAAILSGLSPKIPCTTVNKVCGSGLKAVMLASQSIALYESRAAIAGGMESMSNAPYFLAKARQGLRMGDTALMDLMIHDGLTDPYGKAHMGLFGEKCAQEFSFSREEQDAFAHKSYQKALYAQEQGYFNREIATIRVIDKAQENFIKVDEEPGRYRADKVSTLRPVFSNTGTITAANASKINDGAAALIVSSEKEAKAMKIKPKARIIASATFAHEPEWFTTAPAFAIKAVLERAGLKVSDIDLFEINEAFSVVALYSMKELGLSEERLNVFGGAIALGHPIGCSGARLLVTLLNALSLKKKRFGCVAVCLGGGEAVAMIVENVL
jgi:acetyl-CoA C-acetyltransferase